MFSDEVTRRLLAEVKSVLRCGGLLLLHVNSDADRELRAEWRRVKLELKARVEGRRHGRVCAQLANRGLGEPRAGLVVQSDRLLLCKRR